VTQLVRMEVKGMLGRFNHIVEFPSEWEFVILHGPNGVGKTKLLELISNTFSFRLTRLASTPFEAARFDFDDGRTLAMSRIELKPSKRPSARARHPQSPKFGIHLELRANGRLTTAYTYKAEAKNSSAQLREYVAAVLPVQRVGASEYMDIETEDILSLSEVLELYGHMLPPELLPDGEQPRLLQEYLSQTNVYLIETQRLLNLPQESSISSRRQRQEERPKSMVASYSEDLARRLKEALAENSRRSQELDRRFPEHLLQGQPAIDVTDEQIRERYSQQAEYRSRLAMIDLLGTSADFLPLPDRDLKEWERHVLWTYLEDTEEKLGTFRGLLSRVRLLQEIVNSRFKYKSLQISRDSGFRIVNDDTGEEISVDRLSSGEQHELVLVYGLLFRVRGDALVLIDEPEISLHVGWQRKFLADLFEISQLTSLRFIIATHSPQIIHKWWDRTTSLVPENEMDDSE
jgi:energy-coupling factor transporter ATP-binding protein EcfA2